MNAPHLKKIGITAFALSLMLASCFYLFGRPLAPGSVPESVANGTEGTVPKSVVTCPDSPVYKIPYSYGGRTIVSGFYLRLPMTQLNMPWKGLKERTGADKADAALKDLLTAIYDKNYNLAEQRIDTSRALATFGSIKAYIDTFNSSLAKAGDLVVYGRIDGTESVRFVLRGSGEPAYRVLKLRREAKRGYVLDESTTPNAVEILELSIFRLAIALRLEVAAQDVTQGTSIALADMENACTPSLIVRLEAVGSKLFDKNQAFQNAAVNYFRNCYWALQGRRTQEYFSCFGDAGADLGNGFEQLNADQKALFVRRELDREPAFILSDGPMTAILYRQRKDSSNSDFRHQIIIGSGITFELVGPAQSGVFDDVLNSSAFQAGLKRAVANVEQE